MPRNPSTGIYTLPPGTGGTPNQPISSTMFNTFAGDIAQDLNGARPISAGGTGATNATQARTNLGLGSAAIKNTGTSGDAIPLLNGANTFSNLQTFDGIKVSPTGARGIELGPSSDGNSARQFFTSTSHTYGEAVEESTGNLLWGYGGAWATGIGSTLMSLTPDGNLSLTGSLGATSGGTGAKTALAGFNNLAGALGLNATLSEPRVLAIDGASAGTRLDRASFLSQFGIPGNLTLISAGNGLTGGGTLETNRTLTLGTPSAITGSSTNSVGSATHSHALDFSGLPNKLNAASDSLPRLLYMNSNDTSTLARIGSGTDMRTAFNLAAGTTAISAGTGLTGGGDLSANRTLSVDGTVWRDGNQPTTSQIGAIVAGLAVNSIGSYAMLLNDSATTLGPGDTIAGSSLRYTAANPSTASGSPTGTWRCMGRAYNNAASNSLERVTNFVKIM